MENTHNIQIGDVVYDPEFREVFTYSRGDRFVLNRLIPATEDQKRQLKESGKDVIEIP